MSCRRSEALASSLVTEINLAMAKLVDIWDSIGIMEDQRVERMQTVKKHIDGLLHSMIMEEEALRHRIKTDIFTSQKQLDTLCLELALEPYKLEEGLTVLQLEKNLRCHVESLQKEKDDRMRELNDLSKRDEKLCVTLCATPYYIPTGSVPSRSQLQELQEHVEKLNKEKEGRVKVFSGLREDIKCLMDEMGHEPESSLEKDSICPDADIFLLTHDNIKALKLLLSQLEMKKESLISAKDKLKERATSLWNRLSCPEPEGEAFREAAMSTLSDDIRRWRGIVEHLEEMQMAQLEVVIDKVRQELVVLWDKCMFGPEQREPFDIHFCDETTEELLAVHDEELLRMKAVYETAQPILEDLEKWKRNWAFFQEFERKAADPARFSNRGGSLLRESKDRAKVQKLLPKLEEELRGQVEDWENNKSTPFLVYGQRVMDFISGQWEEHRQQKDKEKNERMTKKAETSQFKTPTKRPLGMMCAASTPTPKKVKKTPSQLAPRSATASAGSSTSSTSSSSTFLCVPGRPPLSTKRNKTAESSAGPRTPLQEFNSDKKPVPMSYTDFTSELSRKASFDAFLNSTVRDML
ncbi:protein regulator of cytokinesis 1 isoform X2 [Triplophysa rosa]|uniref:protein regulator of cytokinesis 1 isoform X2 n=1 Tax=Triplophysa rosa TaxID=992332 RepID=UPI0025462391|nr:protein regulator of cytokinesis 1 isoform X2 [Triplophysa rosa]